MMQTKQVRFMKRIGYTLLAAVAVLSLARPVAGQTVEYYHLDALGSVRVITDQNGAVVERHDYLPFGEEWNPPASTAGQPLRFTGKERNKETGFDYFGARYYASRAGRFTTVDPVITLEENLVDPQRWNRYAYVRNNPLRHTDPDGRCIDGCVLEAMTVMVGAKITADVTIYLSSPQGQRAMRDLVGPDS
jgi:RHS repeat-associated protein